MIVKNAVKYFIFLYIRDKMYIAKNEIIAIFNTQKATIKKKKETCLAILYL